MRSSPLIALFAGATFIALSPIWVRVSEVGPTASALWRVALAVPLLWLLFFVLGGKEKKFTPLPWGRALAAGVALLPDTATGWLKLLGLAWISHAAGQGLIAYALAHLPAGFSSVGLLFQPVMAALFAWVLLGESLSVLQVVGGTVVLAGIALARLGSAS